MWVDLWLQGGSIIQQFGESVIYDATSRWDARLVDFIGLDGDWSWPSVEDRWVWILGNWVLDC